MKVKIGDKVRFLSETGGGKVAGFQKGNIVLVEDEDGFQIPTPITDIVVVEQDDYSMGKMINEKMDAREAAEAHANTELAHDSRSIKSMLSAHDEAVSMEVDDYDPADREITFQKQVEERQGGNKLSAFLALPVTIDNESLIEEETIDQGTDFTDLGENDIVIENPSDFEEGFEHDDSSNVVLESMKHNNSMMQNIIKRLVEILFGGIRNMFV